MSFSLARGTETAARLLDSCGAVEPLRLCMSARDVQVEVCAGGSAARASLERLAAAVGTTALVGTAPAGSAAYSLTADLAEGIVLVAGIDEPAPGARRKDRSTSTADAAELLRTLEPWVRGLGRQVQPVAQLWVEDQGDAFTVQLLATAGMGEDPQAVATAAGRGLDQLRVRRTDSGLDGTGRLPCGRTVRIGVVSLL
ncbi:hypothetical protein ACFXKW_32025 [Streptomyces sp. NPDC059193]|uniref:hypothetical protein n=1 Tax=Streptomyces sp. NPDC059193 TaxID=3346763 RepID=UPI003695A25F